MPDVSLRTQLYCASDAKSKFCARPAPSRNSVELCVPPTASRRVAAVQLAGALVLKSATPAKGADGACAYMPTPMASAVATFAPP
jgi:hypothetical protein